MVGNLTKIVVYGDVELATWLHELLDGVQSLPHRARMVQDSPRIYDIELAEPSDELGIQNRALPNGPILVIGQVAPFQLLRAGDGVRIVVERADLGAKPPRREAE